jgi:hypothetical protein
MGDNSVTDKQRGFNHEGERGSGQEGKSGKPGGKGEPGKETGEGGAGGVGGEGGEGGAGKPQGPGGPGGEGGEGGIGAKGEQGPPGKRGPSGYANYKDWSNFKNRIYAGMVIHLVALLVLSFGFYRLTREQSIDRANRIRVECIDYKASVALREQWKRVEEIIVGSQQRKPGQPGYIKPGDAGKLFADTYKQARREAGDPPICPQVKS